MPLHSSPPSRRGTLPLKRTRRPAEQHLDVVFEISRRARTGFPKSPLRPRNITTVVISLGPTSLRRTAMPSSLPNAHYGLSQAIQRWTMAISLPSLPECFRRFPVISLVPSKRPHHLSLIHNKHKTDHGRLCHPLVRRLWLVYDSSSPIPKFSKPFNNYSTLRAYQAWAALMHTRV